MLTLPQVSLPDLHRPIGGMRCTLGHSCFPRQRPLTGLWRYSHTLRGACSIAKNSMFAFAQTVVCLKPDLHAQRQHHAVHQMLCALVLTS
jgi:hypothetical protein